MMMKNCLFAVTLLSVALCGGCATGGGGHTGGNIEVSVNTTNPANQQFLGVTLTIQFAATVTGTTETAVTWSVSSANCTGSACGTIDPNSGLYRAPAAAPTAGLAITVTATLISSPTKTGTYPLTVLPIGVLVTPKFSNGDPLLVAKSVRQPFTAIVTPDAENQTVTWSLTCDAGGNACGTIDPNTGVFTAANSVPVSPSGHVTATSTVDATASATVDIMIVASRLVGSTTYAFHFSGFDNNGPIAVAGNFTTNADGTAITGGIEDDLTISQYSNPAINSGSLALDANDHGVLTLNTSAGSRAYKIALDADGDGRMIEFDGTGRQGSGQLAQATPTKFKTSVLPAGSSYTFGMTGVVTTGPQRAGFAGVVKADGAGNITSGMLDKNENGTSRSASDITGKYQIDAATDPHPGRGTMTLTSNTLGKTYNYAIYMIGGQASKATNPLTLFAISTDDPQTNPGVSGTIVFQDPTPTYVNSDFTDFWVSNLTGVDNTGHSVVSLTSGAGDGNGHLSGFYFANNAGVIPQTDSSHPISITNYAYASTGGGRFTLDLLGNASANPAVPPVHFVLYSSAASRGFLLSIDPSSATVFTGTMDQQPVSFVGAAELAGSFTAATANSGASAASQAVMNLLFTSALPNFTLSGQQDETDGGQHPGQPVAGAYTLQGDGSGTIALTQPGTSNYVICVLDNPLLDKTNKASSIVQHFVMINVDPSNTNPSVIFGER